MTSADDVICIIPARGGSKGIRRKNLASVGGVPLIGRTVVSALQCSRLDRVFVSTDDPEIADVARDHGAEIIERPLELASDSASSEGVLLHALEVVEERYNIAPRILVFLQCTSPFTTADEIGRCVAALDDPDICSAVAVTYNHGFLWAVDEIGHGRGVTHDESKPRIRRQDLPAQYLECGSVYAVRAGALVESKTRFCPPIRLVEVSQFCPEIDSPQDLAIANALAPLFSPKAPKSLAGIVGLVMDFDGVHTDDRVLVLQDGLEGVFCSRRDGMGLEMLREAGYELLILSKEKNPVVVARARKLGIEVIASVDGKAQVLSLWARSRGIDLGNLAYIGNDVNDLECLRMVGLSISPADGHVAVTSTVDLVTRAIGGYGALREVADLLLAANPAR